MPCTCHLRSQNSSSLMSVSGFLDTKKNLRTFQTMPDLCLCKWKDGHSFPRPTVLRYCTQWILGTGHYDIMEVKPGLYGYKYILFFVDTHWLGRALSILNRNYPSGSYEINTGNYSQVWPPCISGVWQWLVFTDKLSKLLSKALNRNWKLCCMLSSSELRKDRKDD